MRILHVVPSYYPAVNYGGPIYAIHQLCAAQVLLGLEVDVFTTNRNGPEVSNVPIGVPVNIDGVNVYYFPCMWLMRFWYYSFQMSKAFKRELRSYNFIHNHSIFLWPTFGAAYFARKFKIPYCISPRGSLVASLIEQKSRFRKLLYIALLEKKNLKDAQFVHTTSELEAVEIKRLNLGVSDIEVVPNGVKLSDYDLPCLENRYDFPYLLYLGRISWKKRIDLLIKAMPNINFKFKLIIAGNDDEGERSKLEETVRELNLSDRVQFIGFIEGIEKIKIIKNSSLLTLPSENENFGNVILEAWACRKPVAVSRNVGLADIVIQHSAGILISSSPELIAKEINNLIADTFRLKELGDNGCILADSQFQWSSVANRLRCLYEKYSTNY
jgi:glycosyltransferase involved in cell wall biosynthesis